MTDPTPRHLSSLLSELQGFAVTRERVSLDNLLLAFHERGFGFLLFFLGLPMGLPIPVPPGVNIVLALPLIFLTAQQAMGRHTPWFPKKMRHKTLSTGKILPVLSAAGSVVGKMEILLKPRMGWVTQGVFSNLIGLAGFVMALSICVPLPLTNTVPSFGIALMAAGVLMRDGLAVLVGMVVGLLWVVLLLFLGQAGLRALLDMLF